MESQFIKVCVLLIILVCSIKLVVDFPSLIVSVTITSYNKYIDK